MGRRESAAARCAGRRSLCRAARFRCTNGARSSAGSAAWKVPHVGWYGQAGKGPRGCPPRALSTPRLAALQAGPSQGCWRHTLPAHYSSCPSAAAARTAQEA